MNNIKAVAGYSMLMILASADNKMDPAEERKIGEFVKNNFDVDPMLELSFLSDLDEEKYRQQFAREAEMFFENSTPDERQKFIEYAKNLILADHNVSVQENKYLKDLYGYWKMQRG